MAGRAPRLLGWQRRTGRTCESPSWPGRVEGATAAAAAPSEGDRPSMQQTSSAVVPVSATHERAPRRRRGILAVLLGLTVVSLGAGLFSLAVFTDSDTSTGSFATGTLDIATTPSTSFSVTGMVPGDTATQALTIANGGTVALRYAFSSVASNLLG